MCTHPRLKHWQLQQHISCADTKKQYTGTKIITEECIACHLVVTRQQQKAHYLQNDAHTIWVIPLMAGVALDELPV